MRIEYFKEFAVLAKLLNYEAAAEQLYITQPTLTRHMQALEKHLGVKLLLRSAQGSALSEEGKAFYGCLPEFLESYDRLLDSVALDDPGKLPSVRIGIPDYAINDYLKNAARLTDHSLPVEIEFFTDKPDGLIFAVIGSKADGILIPNISFPGSRQLRFYDLFEERLGILCSIHDPLAKQGELDIREIQGRDMLYVDSPYFDAMWALIGGLCLSHGFSPGPPRLFRQVESLAIEINSKGRGIGIFGEHMRNISAEQVSFIPFKNPECVRTIGFCCRREDNSRAMRIMRRALKAALREASPS